tara:strand:+ start:959 stop:1120 length:162 start_codon:yes stop_codon:yes gene_type:complete
MKPGRGLNPRSREHQIKNKTSPTKTDNHKQKVPKQKFEQATKADSHGAKKGWA